MDISPKHDFAGLINPNELLDHISDLTSATISEPLQHSTILKTLVDQTEPVDFFAAAFPEYIDKRERLETLENEHANTKDQAECKELEAEANQLRKSLRGARLTEKHYLILAIENLMKMALSKNWGLCKHQDFVYLYNGIFWSELDHSEFEQALGLAAEKMAIDKFNAKYFAFREKLLKQFLSYAHFNPPTSQNDNVLINLKNGTFEIKADGETHLRPFQPDDFLTYQLPFDYDPTAQAPIFHAYLNRVQPDEASRKVLAEYLGYIFIRNGNKNLKEEKALVLYGSGANGKSVFFEIVCAMLGVENVSNYSLQSLTSENGYHRAKIASKLLNYASEINGNLEASLFKQMISGEPLEARLPYGEPFIMKQYAKMIFNCNELPREVEHTNAFFRRFLIVPFEVTIPPEEQDKSLHLRIIENELSGVFNWVLEGLSRLISQRGFSQCEAAKRALDQYRVESDSVQMFLMESGYSPSTSETETLKSMYSNYRTFCIEGGYRCTSNRVFSKRLKNAGYDMTKRNVGTVVFAQKEIVF